MKYIALILLFTLQSNADNLACSLQGEEYITIYGLSRDKENHQATVRFQQSPYVKVDVKTLKFSTFFDWGGERLEMKRLLVPATPLDPKFDFKIEINQVTGGHSCQMTSCKQSGIFYTYHGTDPLVCVPLEEKLPVAAINVHKYKDYCMEDCGRPCLKKPIFCGMW